MAEFPTDNYGNRVSFRFVSFRARSRKESSKYSSSNNNNAKRFLDLQYLFLIVLLYESFFNLKLKHPIQK